MSFLRGSQLLRVIVLNCALLAGLVSAGFPEKKYDCSNIINTAALQQFADICPIIASQKDISLTMENYSNLEPSKKSRSVEYSLMNRFDVIEMCSCNLLRHTFVWQALLTHEVDSLFTTLRLTLDWYDGTEADQAAKDPTEVTKENVAYQQDGGEYLYFWDKFESMLRRFHRQVNEGFKPTSVAGDIMAFTNRLMGVFAQNYFDHEEFRMVYKEDVQRYFLPRLLSKTCNSLVSQFEPFIIYFGNLKKMAQNSRFTYRLASYDEALFKIVAVVKVCQILTLSGVLI